MTGVAWAVDQVDPSPGLLERVVELCAAALPDESWSVDELEGVVCASAHPGAAGSDPSVPAWIRPVDALTWVVFDGDLLAGVAVVTVTDVIGVDSVHLQLLAVHPSRRRRGIAAALVGAVDAWAAARGVQEWWAGAGAPFYLFTGVDTRWTEALSALEALGLERHRVELDLVCPTAEPPRRSGGVGGAGGPTVGGVLDDDAAAALVNWVAETFPQWTVEFARAAAAGTVVVARDAGTGTVVGAAAHSVSRFGVVGPVAVAPDVQRGGVGTELMRAVLADLRVAGLRSVEISWTSTVRFFATACGARVGRSSVVLRRDLGVGR